jgi:hypothetical protein
MLNAWLRPIIIRRDVFHINEKVVPQDIGGGMIQYQQQVNTTYHESSFFYLRDKRNCGSRI